MYAEYNIIIWLENVVVNERKVNNSTRLEAFEMLAALQHNEYLVDTEEKKFGDV